MSFGDPNNPYGQPPQAPPPGPYGQPAPGPYGQQQPQAQPGYGYPQQAPAAQPYGYPQQAPADPQYGYPQQQPAQPYAGGYAQQPPAPPYGAQGGGMPGMGMSLGYASWGARLGATLIDGLIMGLLPGILFVVGWVMVVSQTVKNVLPDTSHCAGDPQCISDAYSSASTTVASSGPPTGGLILMSLAGLVGLIGFLFMAAKEGSTGQTPGKKALNIKLVSEATGQPLGFGMAVVRRICHIVDSLPCYIGYLWPLWDEKSQTFADKFLGTVVVRTK
ncbi:RDD family protein [Streptomyces sp. NPDC003077]|uniref:RDD family protein n=1 Tax=Streptomyces sp. NPDC003077 TaxID=3154443 RepID=UPI0033B220FF